jgi:hypothetical protein
VKRIALLAIALAVALAGALYWTSFVAVDRCLDAGGRWNAVAGTCEMTAVSAPQ